MVKAFSASLPSSALMFAWVTSVILTTAVRLVFANPHGINIVLGSKGVDVSPSVQPRDVLLVSTLNEAGL